MTSALFQNLIMTLFCTSVAVFLSCGSSLGRSGGSRRAFYNDSSNFSEPELMKKEPEPLIPDFLRFRITGGRCSSSRRRREMARGARASLSAPSPGLMSHGEKSKGKFGERQYFASKGFVRCRSERRKEKATRAKH